MNLPERLGNSFSSTGNIEATKSGAKISNLIVKLHDTQGTGSIEVKLNNTTELNIQLAFNKFNLDSLLAPSVIADLSRDTKDRMSPEKLVSDDSEDMRSSETEGKRIIESTGFKIDFLPNNINVTVDLSVAAITFNKSTIRQAKISAILEDKEITVSQASALLPGSTDLGLQGIIFEDDKNKNTRFIGSIDLATNNLRELLVWANKDVSSLPKDRLRKLNFSGKVLIDSYTATLDDILLQLDETKITGGIDVPFRPQSSFRADLNIDRLNLDTYLSDQKVTKVVQNTMNKNLLKNESDKQFRRQELIVKTNDSNLLTPLAVFGTYNANLKN